MSTGWNDLNLSPYSSSSPARQSIRWRHSGEPYRDSSSETPSRSETFSSPYFSAVFFSVPTALALANGVGSKATRPSFSNSSSAFSHASVASDGTSSGSSPKNEVSAVLAYSGYPETAPDLTALWATVSEPR